MNTVTLHFRAEGQKLIPLDGIYKYASNTVEYIRAVVDLGDDWTDFDVVRAAWFTDYDCIVTVLDPDGVCMVPAEVLNKRAEVTVNLFGCDVVQDELVDRLTTYPVKAILIDANARVCGSETAPVTPSQFEQFIAIVEDLVHTVRDIDRAELNPDYTLTIYYTDGTSDTVGPIRGEQGPQGNGIVSIYKSGESGAVKTYTILFTDGNTFEYNVTDGEVTFATLEQLMPKDTASGDIASFPDGQAVFPLQSCVVNIEPVQAGSGTPSPDNVRPITGWTGCNVVVSPTEDAQDGTTYTITWQDEAGTVYGGTVDVVTGVLTVTHQLSNFPTSGWVNQDTLTNTRRFSVNLTNMLNVGGNNLADILCSQYPTKADASDTVHVTHRNNALHIFVDKNTFAGVQAWETYLQGLTTLPQVWYPLATTQTYQLDTVQVACLLGRNNVWANCGSVAVRYIADIGLYIDKKTS